MKGHAGIPRAREWLDQLFAGQYPFSEITPSPLPHPPAQPAEYDAMARAAASPDGFLIHADPLRSASLIAQLARTLVLTPPAPPSPAPRVLILTPYSAAADRISEQLLQWDVAVVRALAEDENPLRETPAVSRVTSLARGLADVQRQYQQAVTRLAEAEKRMAAFAPVAKAIARLAEVQAILAQQQAHRAACLARREQLEQEVRDEVGTPFAIRCQQWAAEYAERLGRLTAELDAQRDSYREKTAQLQQIQQQLAEASRKPGLLARLFGSKAPAGLPDPAELDKQRQTLAADCDALAARVAELEAQRDAEQTAFPRQRDQLLADEIAHRRAAIDAEIALLTAECTRAEAEWTALRTVIAQAAPGDDPRLAEEELTTARQQVAETTLALQHVLTQMASETRIVVATPQALENDPFFTALSGETPFGWLIFDRAEELPEAEFIRLSRWAERWIFVADVPPADHHRPTHLRASSRHGRFPEYGFISRLAAWLDRETWTWENDALVCRLLYVSPLQRPAMTREPLADRPAIELRFIDSEVTGEALLAEIAFPPEMDLPAAKTFLFHTLGEVLLRPCGPIEWQQQADALAAVWPVVDTAEGTWIDLEPGIREKIVGTGPCAFTAAVRFDTNAGWDSEKAVAWLHACWPSPITSRFAALARSKNSGHLL
ncbi:MAG: hypothetical protein RMJ56_16620 [Gemmataceae bacterium]|nr:hypothetical protein [Gemmata sp.]MDW8199222.1 hypothetical protein [Gemmataceae bacterium]